TGTVDVTVSVSGQTSAIGVADRFTYVPPPTVASISPNSGPVAGSTTVTITGTNFSTTSGATAINFGALAGTGVSCASTTQCSVTSPAGCGTVDVIVTVNGGTSATSSADRFSYTPANAPCVPTLQSPAEGTQNISTTPTFTWLAPQGAVPGSTVYTLAITDANGIQYPWPTTTATSYAVPTSEGILPGHEIFWSVSACNGSACSPFAQAWGEFVAPLPGTPTMSTPAEGSTGLSTTPTLTWQAPTNAFNGVTTYVIALSDATPLPGGRTHSLAWLTSTTTSVTVPASEGIYAGDYFYWAVQACNGGNACGPSARAWGETTAPPGVPALSSPAEGTH